MPNQLTKLFEQERIAGSGFSLLAETITERGGVGGGERREGEKENRIKDGFQNIEHRL